MSKVISIFNTTPGKFQALSAALDEFKPLLANLEQQFGELGMISRFEKLVERVAAKKLGWNVKIFPEVSDHYILKVLISTIIPTIHLSRKFAIDLVKALRTGSSSPVIQKLRTQLMNLANKVRSGEEPFEERFKTSYIMIEASTAGASFQAALPVDALSLVDTEDADKAYRAKEVKKNVFVLKPTTEQIKKRLIEYCVSNGLQSHLEIVNQGNIKIIKERILESNNKTYKQLGNKSTISNIKYDKEL